jgi:hypothetical protein
MKERSMREYYVYFGLFPRRQAPYSLARSALPHAPVLPTERSRRPAGWLRHGAARALFGLAARLDPQAGHLGSAARQAPAC